MIESLLTPTLERLLSKLDGVKRSGVGYLARCPAHEDRTPSLSISEGDDGRILVHCHAGCTTEAVVAAVGLSLADLAAGNGNSATGNGKLGELVATYRYVDEDNNLLYEVCRYEPKTFRQRRPDGVGGWQWNLNGTGRVLYHLPALIAAVKSNQPIYICEGEKDVEALEQAGAVATCNAGGAGKWRAEYNTYFAHAQVIIVADNDEPGRKHAAQIATSLHPVAASVAVVHAAAGKDASDHLAAGHTLAEFVPGAPVPGDAAKAVADDDTPAECDAALAEILADEWLGQYRWAGQERAWLHWNGKVWATACDRVVGAAAQRTLQRHFGRLLAGPANADEHKRWRVLHRDACQLSRVTAALTFLSGAPGLYTPADEWDADPHTLNCADGILDLRTQIVRPHDPAAFCTRITKWGFADTASTGAWQRHIERCLPNLNIRRQVQRDLGRALVGGVLEESLPIWYGSGGNGKTVTARALMTGLGEYAKKAASGLLVASKYERHPTEIADLAGTRLVFSEETDDGKQLAEAKVKDLAGGGVLKGRFMRGDYFQFEQSFSIFLLTNHKPTITGVDAGIWRRIRLIPWEVSLPLAEQRPQDEVVNELMADGSAVLRWLVAGFADWQADRHWTAEEVIVATAEYRAEQDRLAGFLADCCEEKAFAQVSVNELHAAYVAWGTASSAETLGKIAFGRALKERRFAQAKTADGNSRVWLGLRLRTTSDSFSGLPTRSTALGNEAEFVSGVVRQARNDRVSDVLPSTVVPSNGVRTAAALPPVTVIEL